MRCSLTLAAFAGLLGCQDAPAPAPVEPRALAAIEEPVAEPQDAPVAPPAASVPATEGADTSDEIKHAPTRLRTLANGVTILVREVHAAPVVDLRVVVKNTGSLYEGRFLGAGISHYYEHLVASGTTKNRTEDESQRILFDIGNVTNAYTNYDHTAYFIRTGREHFATALDLISDWIQHCSLDPKEVEREKQVILKEIQKGEDEPARVIRQLFHETCYRVHPMRHPVIGYTAPFLALTYEDLVEFFRNRYVPDNLIVTVVGDVDGPAALTAVESAFKGMPRRTVTAPVLPEEPPQVAPRYAERVMSGTRVAYGYVGWKTIPYIHPDLYALDLLAYILGHGETSRLIRRLRDREQLVLHADCTSWTPSFASGPFFVRFFCTPDKTEAAIAAIRDEVARVLREPPTDEEIDRAKVQNVTAHVFGHERVEDIAGSIALDYMHTGDPDFGDTYVAGLQRVTREDLLRVAREYLRDEWRTVAVVRPPSPDDAPAKATVGREAGQGAPVESFRLANGLRVLLRPESSSPQVSLQAWCVGGSVAESEANNGISAVLAEMLRRGTTSRPGTQLQREVTALGAGLSTSVRGSSMGVALSVLTRDFEQGVTLLADIVRNPELDQGELARVKQRQLQAITQADDEPEAEAQNLWRRSFFQVHPYRLIQVGTAKAVTALDPDALRAHHARLFDPAGVVVAVYGDVAPEAARRAVEAAFGDWPSAPGWSPPAVPAEPSHAGDGPAEIVKESGKSGVAIVIGFAGVPQEHPDRYALDVIDAVTSGMGFPGGWFHDTLRGQEKGLVYVVHAQSITGVNGGWWWVWARTSPDQRAEVLRLMREQFDKIRGDVVTPEELERAKKVCISYRQIAFETNAQRAEDAALNELNGLGHDWSARYAEGINAVTLAEVKRVANQYFQGGLTVVTGPGEGK